MEVSGVRIGRFYLDHTLKGFEVEVGGGAFESEQGFEGIGSEGGQGGVFEDLDRVGGWFNVVAHEHGALVADFAVDEPAGVAEGLGGITGLPELFDAEEDVFEGVTTGDAIEPAAAGEVGDRDVGGAEGLDGLGGELDVAEKGHMVDVFEADFVDDLVVFTDEEGFVASADFEPGGVEVEGAAIVPDGHEPARWFGGWMRRVGWDGLGFGWRGGRLGLFGFDSGQELGFIWQTDRGKGTTVAFRRVLQGRRDRSQSNPTGFIDLFQDPLFQLRGDGEADPLAGLSVIDDGFVAGIAVVAEDKGLDAELDAVRVPQLVALFAFLWGAGFVIDRAGLVDEELIAFVVSLGLAIEFDDVDFGNHAQTFRGEGDRARMNRLRRL